MNIQARKEHDKSSPRGFTLVELLVAIVVLLVVIGATSRIFSTASHVVGMGQASASVLQEAAALERQLREDIARLSHEGFFAIRQVAVPNNVNGDVLLNPMLPEDAIIRADQLVFFTTNVNTPQTADFAGAMNILAQGAASRVYYGHAFQLPDGAPVEPGNNSVVRAHDPGVVGTYSSSDFRYLFDLKPWHAGFAMMLHTQIGRVRDLGDVDGTNVFSRMSAGGSLGAIDATQPEAMNWLLARQAVLLADDDEKDGHTNAKTVYLGGPVGGQGGFRTARSIFIDHPGRGYSREIRNGRVDGAATELDDIRDYVEYRYSDGEVRPWNDPLFGGGVGADQRSIIASSVYYPRAERRAPSMHRVDQALTNHVIGSHVSSFIVEWTWEEGTGEVADEHGNVLYGGFYLNAYETNDRDAVYLEQPWFGLNYPDRGVGFMGFEDAGINGHNFYERANFLVPETIAIDETGLDSRKNNIERYFGPGQFPGFMNPYGTEAGVRIYEAIFGYNRSRPLNQFGEPDPALGYTPWPSAIRVTVVMHDPAGRMEHGREFQFVIDLPRRMK